MPRPWSLLLLALLIADCSASNGPVDAAGAADAPLAPARTVVDTDGAIAAGLDTAPNCNPLRQTCGAGRGCYRSGCAPAGTGARSARCMLDRDCLPGYLCAPAGDAGTACSQVCDLPNHDQYCEDHCRPTGQGNLGYCEL